MVVVIVILLLTLFPIFSFFQFCSTSTVSFSFFVLSYQPCCIFLLLNHDSRLSSDLLFSK